MIDPSEKYKIALLILGGVKENTGAMVNASPVRAKAKAARRAMDLPD